MKICTKCCIKKPLTEFYKDKQNKDGFTYSCKKCICESSLRRYHANSELINIRIRKSGHGRQYSAQYRLKHPEKIKEYNRHWYSAKGKKYHQEWCSKNRARMRELAKIRHAKNPQKRRAIWKVWSKKHPESNSARVSKRRAAILGAIPKWADFRHIKSIYRQATQMPDFVVDHIIPLQNKYVCGLHVENNLRMITKKENSSKGNKLLAEFSEC